MGKWHLTDKNVDIFMRLYYDKNKKNGRKSP